MPDLLVEVGCEELPSSACREIIAQAPELFATSLEALGLEAPRTVELAVAPRRFALVASGVPEGVAATSRRVRGPSAEAAFDGEGAPTRAAEGFARGQGVAVESLVVDEENGRRFVFAERREEGRPVEELVPEVVARLIGGLRFSKTMRWGDGTGLRFSRPVRWIVAKVDERDVPFELYGLVAGGRSQGHRFLGGPVEIGDARSYHQALESVAVIADHERRRARIVSDLDAAAAEADAAWRDPGGKLDEVVFLVEWPSVVTGRFDPRHLALPSRVLVTAMQGHQRYFPLEGADGDLRPAFLAVSNGDPAHAGVIARGYEDVLDARLQDAEFSFERDREAGLEALDARLGAIVFHARLGSMADKRDRLVAGVADIAAATGAGDEAARTAAEAARLAKVDQGSVLVAEFSELEGYAAAVYARLEGVDEAVALAVEEQYLPEGPDSPLPSETAGAILAAAREGRQPDRRVRRRRGADRLQGPLRPAAGRRRARADRPRPRLGRGPVRPAAAGLRAPRRPGGGADGARGRGGGPGRGVPGRPARLPARRGGRGRRGGRRGDGRGARRGAVHRGVGAGARRRARDRGLRGRLDRGHPPGAHRAQGPRRRDRPGTGRRPRRGGPARGGRGRPARHRGRARGARPRGRRWRPPPGWPPPWTASSRTSWSTPTTPACGPAATRWCATRPSCSGGWPTSRG